MECVLSPAHPCRAEVYVVLAPNPYATVYSSASSSPGYIPTAEFSQGIVNFTDIYFTTAGWYTLRIVADGIGEVNIESS